MMNSTSRSFIEWLPAARRQRSPAALVVMLLLLGAAPRLPAQFRPPAPPPEPPADLYQTPHIALALPGEPSLTPADGGGFFPTLSETALLRGPFDARSAMGAYKVDSPDRLTQVATDIFPYQDPVPNFYQRNARVFKPLDHFFGFFTSHDTLTIENQRLRNFAFSLDANTGLLTRNFSPELAMLKAGPLYLDILWIGAGVLYTEFDGAYAFPGWEQDGWASYLELGVRLAARITDTIYLTAGANILYLPGIDRFAFRALTGFPGAGLTLAYSDDWGPWSVNFYNQFLGRNAFDTLSFLDETEADRVGRYWFGVLQPRANEFLDDNAIFFTNTVGASATRLVFDNQWRWWINAEHWDFYRTFNFEDHLVRDHLGTLLGYEGSTIPFAPRFFYDVWDLDGLGRGQEILWHRAGFALTGRLTENIDWDGQLAYLYETGPDRRGDRDTLIWQTGLRHNITRDFFHYLRFGENLFFNDFVNDALVARFVTYGADYRFNRRSSINAFVQYADRETSLLTGAEQRRYGGGASLYFFPLDFTGIRLTSIWETIEQTDNSFDVDRFILRSEVTQRLGMRLSGQLFYQYEDNDAGPRSFTEHVTGLSLRRYF